MHTTGIVKCSECSLNGSRTFCNASEKARQRLETASHAMVYPPDAVLFAEGESPRGVFVLCSGRVKMTVNSPHGRSVVTRLAKAGEVLGVGAVFSGQSHALTAETMEPCQAGFIRRDDFVRLVSELDGLARGALVQLSREIDDSAEKIRSLALSESAGAKLAKLLVDWSRERGTPTDRGIRLKLATSHEVIAQLIGSSRETVTRYLGDFKRREIIEIDASTLLIRDATALLMCASA